MPDLIPHHNPLSPFAGTIRMVVGYMQLAWQSVRSPRVRPGPDRVALADGDSRLRILQIGAEIGKGTALIDALWAVNAP